MAYYLMIEKKKGQYTPIDITKSACFYRMSNLKKSGCTLQEIDMFTMNFYDEKELRAHLFKSGLLDRRDAGKKITTRILRDNKYHKVMYDMFYQKDIEYITNPQKLINRINDKLMSGDYRFIELYARDFSNFHDCSSTAPEVREFAATSIRQNYCSRHLHTLDENNDNPLVRMTKLLIYENFQAPNGKIFYKEGIKYRNLHSVLAYVNNYDKTRDIDNTNNEQISLFEAPQPKVKKLKKNESIPGQINLFE